MSLAFTAINFCHADDRPTFPQHDFIFLTLNSSYTIFGAYYDLGRHAASALIGATADPVQDLQASYRYLLSEKIGFPQSTPR